MTNDRNMEESQTKQIINVLDENIYNKISAGEVVERPASVVKELVENAIDAKATAISVSIKGGGIDEIVVTDNGSGIYKDDLIKAFLPHSTSKIKTADDLFSINTLGFRGEALASISAVSNLTVVSKKENDKAYALEINGGKFGIINQVASNTGTTITVKNLFFNTPARLKFLKKPSGESSEITNMLTRLILSNPNISFKYLVDDEVIFNTQGKGLESAIFSIYGKDTLLKCIKVESIYKNYTISGFIGRTDFTRGNSTYQTLIINGRYVINNTISSAIKTAYSPYLVKRQFPFFVLNLTIPTSEIDVNVHPNKLDVRFQDRKSIFSCFYVTLNKLLKEEDHRVKSIIPEEIPTTNDYYNANSTNQEYSTSSSNSEFSYSTDNSDYADFSSNNKNLMFHSNSNKYASSFTNNCDYVKISTNNNEYADFSSNNGFISISDRIISLETGEVLINNQNNNFNNYNTEKKQDCDSLVAKYNTMSNIVQYNYCLTEQEIDAHKDIADQKQNYFNQDSFLSSSLTYRGTMFNTYLLFNDDSNTNLYIVDQHAGHERILFDNYMEQIKNQSISTQPLLIPYTFTVNSIEEQFIESSIEVTRKCGFDISRYSKNTYRIDGVPTLLSDINLDKYIKTYLTNENDLEVADNQVIINKIAKTACVNAIKAGDTLNEAQINAIIKKLQQDITLKCPHGRPLVVKITKKEIEKWFLRIN